MRKVLDEYVIGQEQAKRALAVAVFNHYRRVRANVAQQSPPGAFWRGLGRGLGRGGGRAGIRAEGGRGLGRGGAPGRWAGP